MFLVLVTNGIYKIKFILIFVFKKIYTFSFSFISYGAMYEYSNCYTMFKLSSKS